MKFPTLRSQLRPVVRAAITSGTLLSCGDVITQLLQRQQHRESTLDWHRTLRFTTIGLTLHGPYFLYSFRALDKLAGPGSTLRLALLKSVTGQLTFFPVYIAAFYAYMGLLEGKTVPDTLSKVSAAFPPTFATGCLFWPAANVVNFMYVPPQLRVAYINVLGIAWTSFLSWLNSRDGKVLEPSTAVLATTCPLPETIITVTEPLPKKQ